MNRVTGLPTATIILCAILFTFSCLSCMTYPGARFEGLKEAKTPIYLPEFESTTSTQDYKVALNFGIALGDAMACIYNENQAASRRYIGVIYDYANKLSVPATVISKLAGINAAIDQGDWQKVLQLGDRFMDQVGDGLGKAGKKDDAILTFVAWNLEGLYITAKSVDNHFSPESAKLLGYDDFVKDLEEVLKPLSVGLATKKEVKAIMAALPKINQIVNRPENYTYTQTDAKELVSICEPLRQTLLRD